MTATKLALAITDLDVGGAERCLQNLAVGLDRTRFDPVVYCLGPRPQNDDASCVGPIEAAGIPVHCLDALGARHLPGTIRRLRQLLTRQSPQILQTFLFHANFVGRLAASRAGVPHILSGIRVAERQCRWHLWLDRWTERIVTRHVCVSQSVAKFSVEQAKLTEHKIAVIPNGIDMTAATDVPPADLTTFGLPTQRHAITFVGRLEEQKGLTWLLDTATVWLPQLPQCDLLLIGHGSQRQALADHAQRLGIASRVHFAGWQPNVLEILAASHLMILPSRWEGMPNVVLQAMALGQPLLATDVEGTRELLGPLADAQLVAYGESEALCEKLLALTGDRSEADRLGRENRLRAASRFSMSAMIAAYQDLWDSLVAHP